MSNNIPLKPIQPTQPNTHIHPFTAATLRELLYKAHPELKATLLQFLLQQIKTVATLATPYFISSVCTLRESDFVAVAI